MSAISQELEKARREVELMTLRSSAEWNRSPAGQMQRQFEVYQRMAKPLSESNFVPSAYKGNFGDCVVAVEIASRLGVPALTVMQNLCVVKGKPTWMSKFLIGCVNTCGRYTTLDYKTTIDGTVGKVQYKTWEKGADNKNHEILKDFERPDLPNLTCQAYAVEKSTGCTLTSPAVSIRLAVMEGWYSKDGSKWPTMPDLMLRYRAASMWTSTFAPEIAMGFRTVEEANDIIDADFEEIPDTAALPAKPQGAPLNTASMEQAKEKLRNRSANNSQKNNNGELKLDMP